MARRDWRESRDKDVEWAGRDVFLLFFCPFLRVFWSWLVLVGLGWSWFWLGLFSLAVSPDLSVRSMIYSNQCTRRGGGQREDRGAERTEETEGGGLSIEGTRRMS